MRYLKFLVLFLLINLICLNQCFGMLESRYAQSLLRMEQEWLHREFPEEAEEIRISRLEEYVFGTIHDVDIKIRYKNLQKAFNMRKLDQYKSNRRNYNRFSGVPTSIPMNVEDLINKK